MAKNISTGIEQQNRKKETDQYAKQWRDIRNKIDVILTTCNVMRTNDIRAKCLLLDQMTIAEREEHITNSWGPLYLAKVQPLLLQLATLERHIEKSAEKSPE